MDIWDKEKRSEVMSKIRSKDTKPELMLRKALFEKGYRYRLHYKKLPGSPDIVLPKYRTAVFVHGCFWHGHENCKLSHLPKSNRQFWKQKIKRNRYRDRLNEYEIALLGWKIVTIWECEISKKKLPDVIDRLACVFHEQWSEPPPLQVKVYEEIGDNITMVAEDIMSYKNRKMKVKKK